MNAVPCLTWVRRGIAKQRPDRVTLTEDDLSNLVKTHEQKLREIEDENKDDSDESDEAKPSSSKSDTANDDVDMDDDDDDESGDESDGENKDDVMKKYDLSDYGSDNEEVDQGNQLTFGGLACFATNRQDPYIANEPDSDDEELEILREDNLVVACRVHNEMCNLEVYVYNEADANLYVHHDMMLPSFPLALEWLDFDPGEEAPGNLVAMGTMEPPIEIWDLDVIDAVEPAFTLAGAKKKKKKKNKDKSELKSKMLGHSDAVLDLSWNRNRRNILASGSADFTIGLWDLNEGSMVVSIDHHIEKVQTLEWHPFEEQTLLSGGFDKMVKIFDCRNPNDTHKTWVLPGEVEKVLWNHKNPYTFLAGTDTGHVLCYDVRVEDKALFNLNAHKSEITGLSLSSTIPGCLVTGSMDGKISVWDIREHRPNLITKKFMALGEIHSLSSSPDAPLVFAVGGERELKVTNLRSNEDVQKHFGLTDEEDAEVGGSGEKVGRVSGGMLDKEDTVGRLDDSEDEEELMLTGAQSERNAKKKKKKRAKKLSKKT